MSYQCKLKTGLRAIGWHKLLHCISQILITSGRGKLGNGEHLSLEAYKYKKI